MDLRNGWADQVLYTWLVNHQHRVIDLAVPIVTAAQQWVDTARVAYPILVLTEHFVIFQPEVRWKISHSSRLMFLARLARWLPPMRIRATWSMSRTPKHYFPWNCHRQYLRIGSLRAALQLGYPGDIFQIPFWSVQQPFWGFWALYW